VQKVSDDAYDKFCACTTGNQTVLRRGYLFARRNIGRPRNLCLQGSLQRTRYDLYLYLFLLLNRSDKKHKMTLNRTLIYKQTYHSQPGSCNYMNQAGSVYRDDCSARYYIRRASPPAAKFRSYRVKRWQHQRSTKSMNRVVLLSLIHYFGVLLSVLRSFMV